MAIWFFLLLVPLLIDVCYTDIRYRIIRNYTTLTAAFICAAGSFFSPAGFFCLPALIILGVGFFLSFLKIVGAGDIKLMAALALSFDGKTSLEFICATALAGVPLIMMVLLASYISLWRLKRKIRRDLPYGVAIVSGFLLTHYLLRASG